MIINLFGVLETFMFLHDIYNKRILCVKQKNVLNVWKLNL